MRLVFSPLAEQDLEAIGDYIAKDNPRRALSFVVELRAQCAKVATAPRAYFYFVRLVFNLMPQGFRPVFGKRIA